MVPDSHHIARAIHPTTLDRLRARWGLCFRAMGGARCLPYRDVGKTWDKVLLSMTGRSVACDDRQSPCTLYAAMYDTAHAVQLILGGPGARARPMSGRHGERSRAAVRARGRIGWTYP